jgi:hypothetical protein
MDVFVLTERPLEMLGHDETMLSHGGLAVAQMAELWRYRNHHVAVMEVSISRDLPNRDVHSRMAVLQDPSVMGTAVPLGYSITITRFHLAH